MAEEEGIATAPAYTWRIKNFSKLTVYELYSDIFVSDGYRWLVIHFSKVYIDGFFCRQVLVCPKGDGGEHLPLYLEVPDSSRVPDGWYRDFESFSITVINQICPKNSIKREMAEEEGIATAPACTWHIKNFSKLTEQKLYSDIFVSDGYRWRLIVYPKGNGVKDLSLYMDVPDSSRVPDGWYRNVEPFSFTLVNQICPKDSMKRDFTEHRFDAASTSWGYPQFIPLEDIHNPAKGYLVADTLVIEVRVSVTSSSDDLMRSKNLLEEMSRMNETSESNLPPNSQFLQQQRKTLLDYLALSLEAGELANAFDEIEKISLLLVQHSQNSLEKTILKDLVSRLPTFRGIRSTTRSTIESLDARRKALSGKRADVGSRLGQGRGQLSSHEAKYLVLSEEELRLNTQKQELLAKKKAMALDRKTINDEVSIILREWKDVGKETEEADQDWLKAREELGRANLSWKLFQQNLQLFQESVKVGHTVEVNQVKKKRRKSL